ncbi:hypothetical protein BJ912DRAFT_689280 [Pholiota molesta]|nr:hypothetical protein BJ912DRAFT_689280 [Pholiota molesta]
MFQTAYLQIKTRGDSFHPEYGLVSTDVPLEPPPSLSNPRLPSHLFIFDPQYRQQLHAPHSTLRALSQTPLYHISVGHYPFLPTCLITSVTKGSDEYGPYIGGFKTMMMSGQENTRFGSQTVTIRGREHRLWQIFTKEPKRQGVQTFRWKPFGSPPACSCGHAPNGHSLAHSSVIPMATTSYQIRRIHNGH